MVALLNQPNEAVPPLHRHLPVTMQHLVPQLGDLVARISYMSKVLLSFAMLVGVLLSPAAATAAVHINKEVAVVHSPDTRECVFFQLSGVTEADPSTPGVPWFAVPKTHVGYKEVFATLMLARATGRPLNHVATSGAVACGHAAVLNLSL